MAAGDVLFNPLLKGPTQLTGLTTFSTAFDAVQSGANPFAGRTVVGSGLAFVVVSTNVVNSDSLIFIGVQAAIASSAAGQIEVTSVVPGVSLTFTRHNAIAAPFASTVMWMIVGPK